MKPSKRNDRTINKVFKVKKIIQKINPPSIYPHKRFYLKIQDIITQIGENNYYHALENIDQILHSCFNKLFHKKRQELSEKILYNLSKYGVTVKNWKEFNVTVNEEIMQKNVVNIFITKHRRDEIVLEAVFVESVVRFMKQLEVNPKYLKELERHTALLEKWNPIFDLTLFKEIKEKGNFMYYQYLNNSTINQYIRINFGIKKPEQQIDFLRLRISYLKLLYNLY
ncbi:hypothetical protein ENUP19_0242G0007 [Entamoeba nuttalli]|uniref:Uncharacterized protein n=2 Tax=Entamoeba nuttalli TaxID=412467 RepID=K2GBK4_ENTNP|nr:hypothetical protein ENU1_109740 [Entamoeba nuttalli P19]EKE39926.1 hypothetical protein ENU1_109740 [Entamoeba nuttalli P19]|eukprot:XP_008857739.1 hypothetical protein ENU1_109740 [Entamoeba nuttalli P19]